MVFYAAFNSISVISRRQLTLFMLSWVSPVLGWALKCLAQRHSHEKTQRIQCGLNPGPLDYKSNTLQLSHAGPRQQEAAQSIDIYRQQEAVQFIYIYRQQEALQFTDIYRQQEAAQFIDIYRQQETAQFVDI